MLASTLARTNQFRRDEKGAVAMMFGLMAIMITMFIGIAIDTGRAMSSRTKVLAAADAAVLAAAKALRIEGKTEAQAKALGVRVFNENMGATNSHWTDVNSVVVTVDQATQEIVVNVDAEVKTSFAGVVGITKVDVPAVSRALFDTKDIEVAVQLDLTGSMCDSAGGKPAPCTDAPKIQGLKDATTSLINILVPATPGNRKVRVAYAPFAAGVNVGTYQSLIADGRTTADNCVYERFTPTNENTDVAPIANDSYKINSDLSSAKPCPSASVVPLTDNKSTLINTISTWVATGTTAGHLGTAWTWNLLSPNWTSVWPTTSAPASYSDTNTLKYAILMTDGEYNTMGGQHSAANVTPSNTLARSNCAAMKAAGIRIFTVGFELTEPSAITTLSQCASNPGDFIQAATPAQLDAAFQKIANQILRLRLTS